jgi:hypothetical protein
MGSDLRGFSQHGGQKARMGWVSFAPPQTALRRGLSFVAAITACNAWPRWRKAPAVCGMAPVYFVRSPLLVDRKPSPT